jgi:hypothetical protein
MPNGLSPFGAKPQRLPPRGSDLLLRPRPSTMTAAILPFKGRRKYQVRAGTAASGSPRLAGRPRLRSSDLRVDRPARVERTAARAAAPGSAPGAPLSSEDGTRIGRPGAAGGLTGAPCPRPRSSDGDVRRPVRLARRDVGVDRQGDGLAGMPEVVDRPRAPRCPRPAAPSRRSGAGRGSASSPSRATPASREACGDAQDAVRLRGRRRDTVGPERQHAALLRDPAVRVRAERVGL